MKRKKGETSQRDSPAFLSAVLALTIVIVTVLINTTHFESKQMVVKERAIIFIPGYYGSTLKKKTGERVWLTASEGLWGSSTLALDEEGLEISGAMALIEDGLLRKVRVVPLLYTVDVYDSFIEKLEDRFKGKAQIIPFSYDWRQDNLKAVTKLDQLVDELINSGTRSMSMIAYSMGGLITTYYLRYGTQDPEITAEWPTETWKGAQKIDRVVLAGVPFRGSMIRFQDMQLGAKFGLNKTLLTGQAISSFPSAYQLLPFFENSKVLSKDLRPIPDVMFDPEYWVQHRWGLMRDNEASPQAVENRKNFTIRELGRAHRFLQWIVRPSREAEGLSIQLLHVWGKGKATLAKAILLKDHEEDPDPLLFDKSGLRKYLPEVLADAIFEEGDGSVTVESASLPQALKDRFQGFSSIETNIGHADIFKDKEVQKQVFAFLDGAEEQ
jgi:pimeloyl-ACP methyl ester carboxylesterase